MDCKEKLFAKINCNAYHALISMAKLGIGIDQEGSSNNRKNLNVNLETLYLARTQFYHLPGFYPKQDFLIFILSPWV